MLLNRTTLGVCAVLLFCLMTATADDYRRPTKVTTSCCKSVSKSRIPYTITDYKRQSHLGPCIAAYIFVTERNGAFCTHPKAPWAERAIQNLKNSKQKSNGPRR
ncbi:eotaxin-like [Lissotriton helveticus]